MNRFALCFFTLITSVLAYAQESHEAEILKWQAELNDEFRNTEKSPLSDKEIKKFKGLEFFPIDSKLRIEAEFVRTPNEMPFNMPTTTDRLPVYQKYGEARFTLEGQQIVLPVFQSHALSQKPGFEDYLFIPFTDLTNGDESYGGGRYLDVRIPSGATLVIDFNKAYNPYCAYSSAYSCPIPPRSSDLPVAIKAGVKAWAEH